MEEPFEIEAMVNGKLKKLTVIPQKENFLLISDEKEILTVCFNCDYECTCVRAGEIDLDTFESISNAIDLHYMLRH